MGTFTMRFPKLWLFIRQKTLLGIWNMETKIAISAAKKNITSLHFQMPLIENHILVGGFKMF